MCIQPFVGDRVDFDHNNRLQTNTSNMKLLEMRVKEYTAIQIIPALYKYVNMYTFSPRIYTIYVLIKI